MRSGEEKRYDRDEMMHSSALLQVGAHQCNIRIAKADHGQVDFRFSVGVTIPNQACPQVADRGTAFSVMMLPAKGLEG